MIADNGGILVKRFGKYNTGSDVLFKQFWVRIRGFKLLRRGANGIWGCLWWGEL